jgi:hypothetical protein
MGKKTSLSNRHRKIALDFTDQISKLAADAPTNEIKRELYGCVKRLNRIYGFTDEEKEQEVMRLILLGASSVQELIRESGFNVKYVSQIIGRLEKAGKIRVCKIRRNETGRPKLFILPAE